MRWYRLLHGWLRLLHHLRLWNLMLNRLLAYRLFRAHRLLNLTLIRRLILVLRRRLTRSFLLTVHAIRGVVNPVNANFTHAFNIVINVIALRLFVIARLHTFQWAIAKHRGTFFTAGPKTVHQ